MKRNPSFRHTPTGTDFLIIGARQCDSGKTFVVREEGNLRERTFLVDGFDIPEAERISLWGRLFKVEARRRYKQAAEKKRHTIRRDKLTKDEQAELERNEERSRVWDNPASARWEYEPQESLEPIEDKCEPSDVIESEVIEAD